MTEPDPFTGQWRDISSVLTDQPEATPDRRINRLRARAEEKRTNRRDAIQVRAEERRSLREERRAARTEARELRAERRTDRADNANRLKGRAITLGRSALVAGPILAPMAVAWTGQSRFATQILGWDFVASILYAAAYELTTAYWAWLYHEARSDGDSGLGYRLGTWIFATGAAVQQWWHYSNHWHATPRAVTYSVMSGVGVLSWEALARLMHRRKLRKDGKLAPARPSIGLARWVRYPVRSWTAWSLITLEGHHTLDAAWNAADVRLAEVRASRSVQPIGPVRRFAAKRIGIANWVPVRNLPPVPASFQVVPGTGSANPTDVPTYTALAAPGRTATGSELELPALEPAVPPNQTGSGSPEPAAVRNQAPAEVRPEPAANLGDRGAKKPEQVQQVLNLIAELGYNAVTLPVVQKRTGMSKTTAHHRLKEARAKWNQQAA